MVETIENIEGFLFVLCISIIILIWFLVFERVEDDGDYRLMMLICYYIGNQTNLGQTCFLVMILLSP